MNLTSPSHVRALLAELGISPQKRLGQNFLIDVNIRDIIIRSAHLSGRDRVLEVGPGLGVLTEAICGQVGEVIAVEKDRGLAAQLRERLADRRGLEVLERDIRDIDLASLAANKVVSNLPYSSGTRILVEIVKMKEPPELIVVTLQDEVVRRIVSEAGSKNYGMLSAWVQLRYEAERVHQVGSRCFWPVPDVTSAIVRLSLKKKPVLSDDESEEFYVLTKNAFSHRRKQMATILTRGIGNMSIMRDSAVDLLESVGLPADVRPGAIGVGKWCELTRKIRQWRHK